jgi:hypothetical protein
VSFVQWINDWRWAANVRRARAYRRTLSFSQRAAFDRALRPKLSRERETVIDYPDAFYYVGIDDLCRAMGMSRLKGLSEEISQRGK